jgi:uncharacterized protein
MSNRLPIEVNPFRLIEQRRSLSGVLPLQQLPRVRELAAESTDSEFAVEMIFTHSASGLPLITGSVKGEVALNCQRCLEPVTVQVDTQLNVVLTTSQTDREPEEEGYELYIVENEQIFIRDFIEDEILLALPVVPRHDDCQPVKPLFEGSPDDLKDSAAEEKANPFAALKDWKKSE